MTGILCVLVGMGGKGPYNADLLIVAGGASGGGIGGGGGGAGGYLVYSAQSFTPGTVKTVTVGAGGATVSSRQQWRR